MAAMMMPNNPNGQRRVADKTQQAIFQAPEHAGHASHEHSTTMRKVFATLFPFESPAWNSSMCFSATHSYSATVHS